MMKLSGVYDKLSALPLFDERVPNAEAEKEEIFYTLFYRELIKYTPCSQSFDEVKSTLGLANDAEKPKSTSGIAETIILTFLVVINLILLSIQRGVFGCSDCDSLNNEINESKGCRVFFKSFKNAFHLFPLLILGGMFLTILRTSEETLQIAALSDQVTSTVGCYPALYNPAEVLDSASVDTKLSIAKATTGILFISYIIYAILTIITDVLVTK
jgi:hypothetical protein